MLKTSLPTDLLASTTQLTFEYDGIDGGSDKLVEKLSKIRKFSKAQKVANVIGLKKTKFPDFWH